MNKYIAALAFVLSCLLFAPLLANAATKTPVRFNWISFQFFWNKTATPHVRLDNAQKTAEGYFINYGYTTTLHIYMTNDIITGYEARFVGGGDNDAGGPQFLRLIHQGITAGSFRWPAEKVLEARETFSTMSPIHKEFTYASSRLTRTYAPDTGWSFRVDYLPEE